ncbi:hypothetical protein [Micromonospora sp. NPDC023737]|uniref:hypothetical protein n=1 Tax=unclassified Micromonospora TaxID=2617518 RepID=UPI0033D4E52C
MRRRCSIDFAESTRSSQTTRKHRRAGYERAGHGIKTPVEQPADGGRLAPDKRAYSRLLRGLRWQGERGFAILIGCWKTLRHNTASPRRIGDIVAAALHLTDFEYRNLPESR